MEDFTTLSLVLIYIIPPFLVIVAVGVVLYYQQKKETFQYNIQSYRELLKHIFPLKISAYERAILFLERIRPENLLPRCENIHQSAQALQIEMLHHIREEYEHNLAQQLYISNEGWESLVNAKEIILNIINNSAQELTEDSTGMELGKIILEKVSTSEEIITQNAITMLKRDLNKIMEFTDNALIKNGSIMLK